MYPNVCRPFRSSSCNTRHPSTWRPEAPATHPNPVRTLRCMHGVDAIAQTCVWRHSTQVQPHVANVTVHRQMPGGGCFFLTFSPSANLLWWRCVKSTNCYTFMSPSLHPKMNAKSTCPTIASLCNNIKDGKGETTKSTSNCKTRHIRTHSLHLHEPISIKIQPSGAIVPAEEACPFRQQQLLRSHSNRHGRFHGILRTRQTPP